MHNNSVYAFSKKKEGVYAAWSVISFIFVWLLDRYPRYAAECFVSSVLTSLNFHILYFYVFLYYAMVKLNYIKINILNVNLFDVILKF